MIWKSIINAQPNKTTEPNEYLTIGNEIVCYLLDPLWKLLLSVYLREQNKVIL